MTRLLLLAGFICLLSAALAGGGSLNEAITDFKKGRMEECLIALNDLVAIGGLEPADEVTAYKYLALASRGLDQADQCTFYLQQLADVAPDLDLAAERFPEDLLATWWRVKGIGRTAPDLPATRTIAFLHFDNASIEDAARWQPMTVGLPAMLAGDFAARNLLTVVERAKIEAILGELQITERQYADPQTAVRVGRLAGAHVLVFGTLMQLSSRALRIDARLVQTETGELIGAVKVDGRPSELLKLEEELVDKLAAQLEIKLEAKARDARRLPYRPPLEATLAYYNGLLHEDQGDYRSAFAAYRKAADLAPEYEQARLKLAALTPFLAKSG